ncbi:hypothetical protein CgunFtcFv8_023347 [Champsocephalus gunnari]|uniref:Uncharacterized protein n=1 Tax=Champsocephalus gunnari TaxID=52237 RepID=A0AAN8DC89_CHAGU|nr:hypothetical protein CgunFtcFv8_023347 [Champsocephalus gunnari]
MQSCQSFRSTHEPSTTHQEQQDEGVLTEQAQPSRSVTGDRPQEDDVSLVDNMMEEMKSRCQDPHFTAGLLAMAKQPLQTALSLFANKGQPRGKREAFGNCVFSMAKKKPHLETSAQDHPKVK